MSTTTEDEQPAFRTVLRTAGAGSIAAAVAVAVEANPFLVAWLVVVGAVAVIVSWQYDRAHAWSLSRPRWFWSVTFILSVVAVAAGGYAFVYGRVVADDIDEVARGEIAALRAQMSEIAALRADVAKLRGEASASAGLMASEKSARELSEKRAASERNRRAAIRRQIRELMTAGSDIKEKARSTTERPQLEPAAIAWARQALATLNAIDPVFAARFRAAEGTSLQITVGTATVPRVNDNVWNYVNGRLIELGNILDTVPE